MPSKQWVVGSNPASSMKKGPPKRGPFFHTLGGANPKGSITAQGESRGQVYLSMTEPQPELLGYAEQTPAEKHLAVSSQTIPTQKKRPVHRTGRP